MKFDMWDSQLVWLSKGWVQEEEPDSIVASKNLWSHRCGLYLEDVNLHFVARKLLIMNLKMEIVKAEDYICDLYEMLSPHDRFNPRIKRYDDINGYVENAVHQRLIRLSLIQVKDDNKTLVELEPLDKQYLIAPYRTRENEDGS